MLLTKDEIFQARRNFVRILRKAGYKESLLKIWASHRPQQVKQWLDIELKGVTT